MIRSILLRGFDQGMASRVGRYMEDNGVKFYNRCLPLKFSKKGERIDVEYYREDQGDNLKEEFDTVILAIGRIPETRFIGLDNIGVKLSKTGKILVDLSEKTNIDNIYAIGDCAEGRPELTPTAIMAGKLLSRRLFGSKTELMDYNNIPTTVFTPLEYGSVGLSEEASYDM